MWPRVLCMRPWNGLKTKASLISPRTGNACSCRPPTTGLPASASRHPRSRGCTPHRQQHLARAEMACCESEMERMKTVHSDARPPRWAEAILRLLLKPEDRESVSGDLLEEYRETIVP